jgi:DNA-binding GntR family transcriptional regulator
MNNAEIAALEHLVARHAGEIEHSPLEAYLQDDPDSDFHIKIAQGSGNPILADLLCDQFYPRLKLCRRMHRTVQGRGKTAWGEHVRILEAIMQRDEELAEILMRRHVRAARTALQSALSGASSSISLRE